MDKKNKILLLPIDNNDHDSNGILKSRYLDQYRRFRLTSFIFPILLSLLLVIGCVLLILSVNRRNTCHLHHQTEQINSVSANKPDNYAETWLPCVNINTSLCVCPATSIHSSLNSSHCIPNYSRCLASCKHNLHCACHKLIDQRHCLNVTRYWIDHELNIGPIEKVNKAKQGHLLKEFWLDDFYRQIENSLADRQSGEYLFLNPNRRTGFVINDEAHDYIFNERWIKVEINTTQQHITYTQLDPQTHLCRMASLYDNGSITQGQIHTCPGPKIVGPYFLGVACNDILVLWQATQQTQLRRDEGWATTRHNFQSKLPKLPVLMDPFHRYYSLYDNLKIEIKDLDGNIVGDFSTGIEQPTKFEFLDQYGTIFIANATHMQTFRSKNDQVWLDF